MQNDNFLLRFLKQTKTSQALGRKNLALEAIEKQQKPLLQQYINNADFDASARGACSQTLKAMETMQDYQQKIDLYASLYNVLGYEIRDITNQVTGGIELLTQNMDEESRLITERLTAAVHSLEGLAQNFNQLFSAGNISQSDVLDLYILISDLLLALSAKISRRGGILETYFDHRIPPSIYGNAVSLFWFLLLQLSNEIDSQSEKNAVLLVHTESSNHLDKTLLRFDLITLNRFDIGLESLKNIPWQPCKHNPVANKSLMKHLLKDENYFAINRYVHSNMETDFHKISIQLDIATHTYPQPKPLLTDKTILLCGDSLTQVDLIGAILKSHNIAVQYAQSPNDVFKAVHSNTVFDAILVTDTLQGIELASFCKTLRHMLQHQNQQTKLLLSVFDAQNVRNVLQHVDHIFYRPTEPGIFIETICNSFRDQLAVKTEFQKKVLIVEDDKLQQMTLGRILTEQQLSYDTALTGEEALSMLEQDWKNGAPPMLVFMDCIMPGMGGIEATRKIRQQEQAFETKKPLTIIGVSALAGEEIRRNCLKAGMNMLMGKPYKRDEIHKVLKKYSAAYRAPALDRKA